MTDWTSGYVAEIDYPHEFTKELAPSSLAFCAAAKGQHHGLGGQRLVYCELGCGQGFSTNLLAAANPHIEFHAMDFNPAQISGASDLAQEAGLENTHFYERSFDDFGETAGLPQQFDVIALHGVYSWVSAENRQHILDFITARLRPGGMVYVSYNALPGWAAATPLRRILADHGAQGTGPLQDRITAAMDYARQLEESGAGYFNANPALSKRLEKMQSQSRNYLAHEFFNKDWTPFHFGDVADDMSKAKLNHIAPADLLDHIPGFGLTDAQQALLQAEQDPIRREALRDILINEQFRADIFIKGARPQTTRGAVGGWLTTSFALSRRYTGAPVKLTSRTGETVIDPQICAPVLELLATGQATVREMLEKGVFGETDWGGITRLLTLLAGSGYITPCLPLEGLADRAASCLAFNTAVCKRAEDSGNLGFLASPVTGSGIMLDRFEQLFLLARGEGLETPGEWADLAWQILAPQGQRLEQDGRVLETPEENLAVLRARAHAFAARKLAILESLGVTLDAVQEKSAMPSLPDAKPASRSVA